MTHDLPSQLIFLSLFAVGQSAYTREDYPLATRIISSALDNLRDTTPLPEGTADAYNLLGWLYSRLGETDKALANYARTIALDSKRIRTYLNRGVLYLDLGDMRKA